jgi:hypothetical protein
MNRLFLNKQGQVSDTITWVVATLIIIVLLLFSVLIASTLGETKGESIGINFNNNYIIPQKSFYAYLLNNDLNFPENKFDETQRLLALKIFRGYYQDSTPFVDVLYIIQSSDLYSPSDSIDITPERSYSIYPENVLKQKYIEAGIFITKSIYLDRDKRIFFELQRSGA